MNNITLFTYAEGNLLIRLLLAHLLADFVFQTKQMAKKKNWNNRYLYIHIGIVGLTTLVLTSSFPLAIISMLIHGLIDVTKIIVAQKYNHKATLLFFVDQVAHLISLVIVWFSCSKVSSNILTTLVTLLTNYQISLIILGYVLVMWPTGYALKFALKTIIKGDHTNNENIEKGGNLIGIFERIIILTFMLLGAYEAIGFLITGKSIIRFAQTEEKLRSEYVLLGTMMSYGVAILVGALMNKLLISQGI
jgi:hypothetical protein